MGLKILIVDDEEHIVELLKFNLEVKGYKVLCAYDGVDGFNLAKEEKPDLVLLDLMLPGIDGIEVCRRMKSDSELKKTPVIMLTAKNLEQDKIKGLEIGADDYITKPFSVKELMARIKAVLRRFDLAREPEAEVLYIGELKIDIENYEVFKNQEKLDLTLKEFELLKVLAVNRSKVLSRNYLLDKIWGYEYFGETRTVDVHIRHLRKKIEDNDRNPQYIETVRGIGYKIK